MRSIVIGTSQVWCIVLSINTGLSTGISIFFSIIIGRSTIFSIKIGTSQIISFNYPYPSFTTVVTDFILLPATVAGCNLSIWFLS